MFSFLAIRKTLLPFFGNLEIGGIMTDNEKDRREA
jgi:hypothetical protein